MVSVMYLLLFQGLLASYMDLFVGAKEETQGWETSRVGIVLDLLDSEKETINFNF